MENEFTGDDLPRLSGIEARIGALIHPSLTAMGYELVRVAVVGRDRPTVQIMADRADGAPFGIEDCEQISRALGAILDVEDPIAAAWNLEVSSAGIDRPLTRRKDWAAYCGHRARVELAEPIEGRRRLVGTIVTQQADWVLLRLDSGSDFTLPLAAVRAAKLVLTDALIEATASSEHAH